MFWTYMLRCSDGTYYTGHSDDLEGRVAAHRSGAGGGYTASRLPVELVWCTDFATRHEALDAELRVKNWSRAKKEGLIAGDWNKVSHFAKPPSRRAPRHDVSTSSTSVRDERDDRKSDLAERELSAAENSSGDVRSNAPRPDVSTSSTSARDERQDKKSVRVERGSSAAENPSRDAANPRNNPVIVLVRPQLGENIGKVARAMLNFGMEDLRMVAPRDGWPNPSAGPAASGADSVLENARIYDTTAEAVADCAHVYATTVRKRGVSKPVLTPEGGAREMAAQEGRSAILFGAERSGLETSDVALARTILTVPINPAFASLNLAQAVILVAYEWSKHRDLAMPTLEEQLPPAPQEELDGFIAHLESLLEPRGYFRPEARAEATRRTLRTMLTKPGWNHLEVRTWRGILSALGKTGRTRDK